jgi:germination protein YpeB
LVKTTKNIRKDGGNTMNKVMEGKSGIIAGIILVVILGGVCIYFANEKQEVVEILESSYTRSFYDLIEYMDNVETLLAKVQISNSSEYAAKTLTDIWRKADLAQSSLAQIPITHMTLEKVVQFLNQLSDYSYTLSQSLIDKDKLSDEELSNLQNYYERAKTINQTLSELIIDLNAGNISWKELTREENTNFLAQEVSNVSQDSFGGIEENMQDYEGLIYDGPFSEHMTSPTPKGLGEGQYTAEMAEEVFYEFVNRNDKQSNKDKCNDACSYHSAERRCTKCWADCGEAFCRKVNWQRTCIDFVCKSFCTVCIKVTGNNSAAA